MCNKFSGYRQRFPLSNTTMYIKNNFTHQRYQEQIHWSRLHMDEDMEFSKPYQHGILKWFILFFRSHTLLLYLLFLFMTATLQILVFGSSQCTITTCLVDGVLHSTRPDCNWNVIWKQQVRPKVHSFMWRLAHSCLSTRTRLTQKGIPCEDTKREI